MHARNIKVEEIHLAPYLITFTSPCVSFYLTRFVTGIILWLAEPLLNINARDLKLHFHRCNIRSLMHETFTMFTDGEATK